jgi:hypothetical protein
MRRQNPPPAHLAKAGEIEKYLRPEALATSYGVAAICYLALVSLLFASMVYESFVSPTPTTITLFAVIAFVPSTVASLAYFLRPDDPLSLYLTNKMNLWKCPISVPADSCTFKAGLRSGEIASITVAFHYPSKDQTKEVKERLCTCVHAALANDFSMRVQVPSYPDIENAVDASLETIAAEYKLPVLYLEVQNVDITRDSYSIEDEPTEYLGTGTLG